MRKLLVLLTIIPLLFSCKQTDRPAVKYLSSSIKSSIELIESNKKAYYQEFRNKSYDHFSAEEAIVWKATVEIIKDRSERFQNFLQLWRHGIEETMRSATHPESEQFEVQEESLKIFYDSLINFRTALLSAMAIPKEEDFALSTTELQIKSILLSVPSDFIGDTSSVTLNGKIYHNIVKSFSKVDLLSASLIIDKISFDALLFESKLLQCVLDKLVVLVCGLVSDPRPLYHVNKSELKIGEYMEVTAGIGLFFADGHPAIIIDGKKLNKDYEGIATTRFKINKTPGQYSIPITMKYSKPDGTKAIWNGKIAYTVVP